jgi:hypothetical protein
VIHKLELELTEQQLHYLRLLFYSFNFNLDEVPYSQLIDTYGQYVVEDDDAEPSDDLPELEPMEESSMDN